MVRKVRVLLIPGGVTLYFNVELVEIGVKPKYTADQEKYLSENPL